MWDQTHLIVRTNIKMWQPNIAYKVMSVKAMYIFTLFTLLLVGCGQSESALDKCTDSKSHLWNNDIKDNRYRGNERYWNAIKECEDKHG